MGFDFRIANEYLYFTYNFGVFSTLKVNGEDVHFWYIRDDLLGRTGKDAAERIDNALKLLKDIRGIEPAVPDLCNPSWEWGSRDQKMLPDNEALGVMAYHMVTFRNIGMKYPNHKFIDRDAYNSDDDNSDDEYHYN